MKPFLNFIVTIVVALILSQFLPWWSVMVAGFVTGLFFSLKRFAVFYIPFLAIFLFWSVYCFWLGNGHDFVMAKKIAVLLPLSGSPYLLIIVTGVVGGLAAGVAGILGKQCEQLVKR